MEVSLSNSIVKSEIVLVKPKELEVEESCPSSSGIANSVGCSEQVIREEDNTENLDSTKEHAPDLYIAAPPAIPPPEMFEIRNSSPVLAAGNKKLKRLMERNKR